MGKLLQTKKGNKNLTKIYNGRLLIQTTSHLCSEISPNYVTKICSLNAAKNLSANLQKRRNKKVKKGLFA